MLALHVYLCNGPTVANHLIFTCEKPTSLAKSIRRDLPGRCPAGQQRSYELEQVARLQFIRQANLAGLTLAKVKELLALVAEGEQGENIPRLKEVLEETLQSTEQKMEELAAFRDSLLYYRRQFEQQEDEG
jgi:DNA-binding transcriptional MerR regulator